jgi:hypothetical protein
MAHGGKRPSSGRPKGTPNKASAKRQAQIAATGASPLDVMLGNMRFAHEQADGVLRQLLAGDTSAIPAVEGKAPSAIDGIREVLRLRQIAQDAAKDAAPYVHPKLASVAHHGPDQGPIRVVAKTTTAVDLSKLTDDEIIKLHAEMIAVPGRSTSLT